MRLSERENNVLMCIAKGLIDKEISAKLGISTHTVHAYIRSILSKMNARTRAHAVAIHYQKILKEQKAGLT